MDLPESDRTTASAHVGHLVVATSQGRWELETGETLLIGRSETADIAIDDPRVSRRHVSIGVVPGGCRVEDLGSTWGTLVNGQPLEGERTLEPPFQLSLGGVDGMAITAAWATTAPENRGYETEELPLARQSLAHAGEVVVIGRHSSCDIAVDDLLVSRRHAQVTRGEDGCLVEDLGSSNGTFIDGQRIERGMLTPGGILSIGHNTFRLRDGMLAPDTPSMGVRFSARSVNYTLPAGKVLLEDVSFSLPKGSLLAVVGGSGAGKSTLLKALSGEQPVTSGEVLFDGRDLYRHLPGLRQRIGVVPQEDVVHHELTALQALEFAADLRFPDDLERARKAERVREVMDDLDLAHHANTKVASLSGGQRKRVSVALELLTKPSLIFLDEPTSGLDDDLVGDVMATLRSMADAGHSVVVITHHTASLGFCDFVLVLGVGGVTAYYGPPSKVADHFGTADYAHIISETKTDPAGAAERFNRSELHHHHVATPLRRVDERVMTAPTEPIRQQSVSGQVSTLVRRQLRIMRADVGHLAFLVTMPLVLAVLALVVPGSQGLGGPAPGTIGTGQPTQILVVLILGAVFMGLSSSISVLVAERPIYRRERSVGLSPAAYLIAKLLVLTVVVMIQSLVMVTITTALRKGPDGAALLGWGYLELVIAVCLCSAACVPLGLWMSATVRTADQIMPLLVVLVMVQLVLSGGLFPVDGRVVLEQLSWLSPSRWGFAAAASTIDASAIIAGVTDPLWKQDPLLWIGSIFALMVLFVVLSALAYRRLRRPYTTSG